MRTRSQKKIQQALHHLSVFARALDALLDACPIPPGLDVKLTLAVQYAAMDLANGEVEAPAPHSLTASTFVDTVCDQVAAGTWERQSKRQRKGDR